MAMQNLEQQKRELEHEMDKLFGQFRSRRENVQKVLESFQGAFADYSRQVDEVEKRQNDIR